MGKVALAAELRRRLCATGIVAEEVLQATSDERVIDAYATCPNRGIRWASMGLLQALVAQARDTTHFLALMRHHQGHDHNQN